MHIHSFVYFDLKATEACAIISDQLRQSRYELNVRMIAVWQPYMKAICHLAEFLLNTNFQQRFDSNLSTSKLEDGMIEQKRMIQQFFRSKTCIRSRTHRIRSINRTDWRINATMDAIRWCIGDNYMRTFYIDITSSSLSL